MPLEIMKTDEMKDGEMKHCRVGGKDLAICRVAGRFYAIDAICPHHGAILAQGQLEGTTVVCPWHSWDFDVTTGKGVTTDACIETYRIAEENGGVVLLDANAAG
jgi:nitrite reductase/ring-hydroxylating ferredoxin subunit